MAPLPLSLEQELTSIVGAAFISTLPQQCDFLARTTLPEGTRPAGVIRPANREQVQAILKSAARHKVPIYPISRGKNWGYGDACAPREGMIILDLSRMDRILEVDADLAYAVIEPGVTQGQLAGYLLERKIPLMLDGNGAGPDASFLGNVLERGFGHSAYGDRFSHSCNFEAVLADGTVVNTGLGSYPGARAQHVYKHGIGPSLDGLLTQSNLAVVTRMTLWLQPKPGRMNFYFIALRDTNAVGAMMDRLRRLFLSGTLRTTMHCFNERRLLASEVDFPWDRSDGKQALEVSNPELLRELCRKYRIPAWAASGSLSGSAAEVSAFAKSMRRALKDLPGLDKLVILDERKVRLIEGAATIFRRFTALQGTAKFLGKIVLGTTLLNGIPSYASLKGGRWRARGTPTERQDPLDSRSGLIWVSPVAPMKSDALKHVLSLSESVFHAYGFEFQVTVSCLNERSVCAVMSICFDHDNVDEVSRARQCEKDLVYQLVAAGYIPYRASPAQQAMIRKASPAVWEALARIKQALDPFGTIAPGHYVPFP